jgi:hypothetical protein
MFFGMVFIFGSAVSVLYEYAVSYEAGITYAFVCLDSGEDWEPALPPDMGAA